MPHPHAESFRSRAPSSKLREPVDADRCVNSVSVTPKASDEIEELYLACYRRLVDILTFAAASRSEAEECVQEAFIKLLHRWDRVSGYDDPEGWLRLVAFRLLSNRRRAARRHLAAMLRHPSGELSQEPDGVRLDLMNALSRLPPALRHVLVLHHMLDLSVEQISADFKINPGTVKSRLGRGRTALALLLQEEHHHA